MKTKSKKEIKEKLFQMRISESEHQLFKDVSNKMNKPISQLILEYFNILNQKK